MPLQKFLKNTKKMYIYTIYISLRRKKNVLVFYYSNVKSSFTSFLITKDFVTGWLLYTFDPAGWPERKSLATSKVFFLWIGFAPR